MAYVSARLYILMTLTGAFMLTEFIVGYMGNSLALVSDSFHMLSDVLALGVAVWARRYSKKDKTEKMTYGWRRAEVVGALMNGVFLLALCVNIIVEAIQRLFDKEEMESPQLILIVGGIGLLINLVGLCLVHEHHGHDHSHGEEHTHDHEKEEKEDGKEPHKHQKREGNLNLRGAFLHVLGDALGSVAVIISALVIWLTSFPERFYLDPIMSLVITAIILRSTIPLIRKSAKILLQAVPERIELKEVNKEILELEGVIRMHEMHVWQLSGDLVVASIHITCYRSENFMQLASKVKAILHKYSIHASTIQPEFVEEEVQLESLDTDCLLKCEQECEDLSCCAQRRPKVTVMDLPD